MKNRKPTWNDVVDALGAPTEMVQNLDPLVQARLADLKQAIGDVAAALPRRRRKSTIKTASRAAQSAARAPVFRMRVPLAPMGASPEDENPSDLPAGKVRGLSRDRRDYVINQPIDNPEQIDYPFGVALLEYQLDDGRSLRRLVPVHRNEKQGRFQGRFPLAALLGTAIEQCAPGDFCYDRPVQNDPEMLKTIDPAQVQTLLRDPFVSMFPQLKQAIEALAAVLEKSKDAT